MPTIFDIREFTVHDGPGVRQTVFFKGCPLRCRWCHNPEGLSAAPQLMASTGSCINCGNCVAICPNPGGSCAACGACVSVCPLNLRQICGKTLSCTELEAEIRKNSDYYASLGGGVTFSGGEPLLQGEHLIEMLTRLSDLHTAVETCGYGDPALFRRVANCASLMILDIKLMNPALHKEYTGVDNTKILENAAHLCRGNRPFMVRIPLIPGITDTRENLSATAVFLKDAKALLQVELLPYHKTAGAKYPMLGLDYTPGFDQDTAVFTPTEIFEQFGIRSVVL